MAGSDEEQVGEKRPEEAPAESPAGKEEDDWIDILENGQLMKRIVDAGDTSSNRPQRGARVKFRLETRIKSTGELVPSETFAESYAFVGDYDVMHGIDLLFPLMHLNEVAQVVIHERFAYGSSGKEPDVPPDCTLLCEVQLLDIEWIDNESQLPIRDRISFGHEKKERGNFWFTRKDFSSATHCYRRAVEFLDASEEEMQLLHADQSLIVTSDPDSAALNEQKSLIRELIQLRATAYNNLAAAQIKSEAFDQALKSVNSSLDLNPDNVKALFRKSQILNERGDLIEAIECLKSALRLEPAGTPESRRIQQEISILAAKRKAEVAKEKKMYRRMLQVSDDDGSGRNNNSSNWLSNPFRKQVNRPTIALFLAVVTVILGIVIFYTKSNQVGEGENKVG